MSGPIGLIPGSGSPWSGIRYIGITKQETRCAEVLVELFHHIRAERAEDSDLKAMGFWGFRVGAKMQSEGDEGSAASWAAAAVGRKMAAVLDVASVYG